jgi:hypothetical protein
MARRGVGSVRPLYIPESTGGFSVTLMDSIPYAIYYHLPLNPTTTNNLGFFREIAYSNAA